MGHFVNTNGTKYLPDVPIICQCNRPLARWVVVLSFALFIYLFSAEIGYLKYDRFASSLTVLSSSALSDARILIQSDIHAVGTLHSLGSTLEKEKEARERSKTRSSAAMQHCIIIATRLNYKINDSINV